MDTTEAEVRGTVDVLKWLTLLLLVTVCAGGLSLCDVLGSMHAKLAGLAERTGYLQKRIDRLQERLDHMEDKAEGRVRER